MKKEIRIGKRTIGEGRPLFIMAECGVTCNYDMAITKALIDAVQAAGADAIKFIFWFPEEILSDKTYQYTYGTVDGPKTENFFEMLDKLRFTLDEWREIKAYADERDVIVFSTVNSPGGIEYTEALGLEAYKLSSWDYNYMPLWRRIAALGKPMLIDTGPVDLLDVTKAARIMKEAGNDQSVFVHCFHTDLYPEMNLRSIPYLRRALNTLVGYSSRDRDDETDIMAVTLGSVVLEKRLTVDRKLPGHHHVKSKEPDEFTAYVKMMRQVWEALGDYKLEPSPADLRDRKKAFRHLVANRDLPKGTRLTPEMLEGKRPEEGISPEYFDLFVGRVTRRDLKYNEALTWDDV